MCWLSVVSSAAIDHSIHARDVASDTTSPAPAPTQDGSVEARAVPYIMQSGQGSPPPPVPQPGGVYPQVPNIPGIMLLFLGLSCESSFCFRWSNCIWHWGISLP